MKKRKIKSRNPIAAMVRSTNSPFKAKRIDNEINRPDRKRKHKKKWPDDE